ncbi:hypothetical protein GEMRC1_006372 [Eukaryota sp. GEM-RC1]
MGVILIKCHLRRILDVSKIKFCTWSTHQAPTCCTRVDVGNNPDREVSNTNILQNEIGVSEFLFFSTRYDILDFLIQGMRLPTPESVRKHQRAVLLHTEERTAEILKEREHRKAQRVEIEKRGTHQPSKLANLPTPKVTSLFPAEAKVAFVIRIRGINKIDPRSRKILSLLRLRQIFNGVFVRINKATINMLRLVEPYIAYGFPSLKTVRQLVYKRGFAKINNQRIPIHDNALIEKHLGKNNVICVEDMINQLFNAGESFTEVNRFLWPFKLNSPRGGLDNKRRHFIEGGQNGNRQEFINQLVGRMI